MQWSLRRSTRAAQKTPVDWQEQCTKTHICLAYVVKEEDVPAELIVNSDQTQLVYAQGTKVTWKKSGSKQVSVIGEDEKCAITLLVSIACSGTLFPLQSISQGHTMWVCPKPTALNYDKCQAAAFPFEFSRTQTYWSTFHTMCLFVQHIFAPYFEAQKLWLNLPSA